MPNKFDISKEQSVDLIVKTCLENGVTNKKQIAYVLATAQHESMNFTKPEEIGGKSQAIKLGYHGGSEYFGRGYVHITHIENYQKFDKLLGMNGELVKHPEKAKEPEIAAKIIVLGMKEGMFRSASTGLGKGGFELDDYINNKSTDYYNARNIVNGGHDKANTIAAYATNWEKQIPNLVNKTANAQEDGPPNKPITKEPTAQELLKQLENTKITVPFNMPWAFKMDPSQTAIHNACAFVAKEHMSSNMHTPYEKGGENLTWALHAAALEGRMNKVSGFFAADDGKINLVENGAIPKTTAVDYAAAIKTPVEVSQQKIEAVSHQQPLQRSEQEAIEQNREQAKAVSRSH